MALGFALHGVIDVSGHRPGAAWPALFLAALAHCIQTATFRQQRWVASVSRILAIPLAAIAVWWLVSLRSDWGNRTAPTSSTLARLTTCLDGENVEGAFPKALLTADEALRIAPLEWRLYYERGVARAATSPLTWVAARDFQTARHLVPLWADLCFTEGKLWMSIDQPDRHIDAWSGGACAGPGSDAPDFTPRCLPPPARGSPSMLPWKNSRRQIATSWSSSSNTPTAWSARWRSVGYSMTIRRCTTFSPAQRKTLFTAWFALGDRPLLVSRLLEQPEWLKDGWPWLARRYADDNDYERAYKIARQFAAVPALPHFVPTKPLAILEEQFRFHPDNFQEGLELYSAQRQAGQTKEAITTLVALQAINGHPAYVTFLESELRAELRTMGRRLEGVAAISLETLSLKAVPRPAPPHLRGPVAAALLESIHLILILLPPRGAAGAAARRAGLPGRARDRTGILMGGLRGFWISLIFRI